MEYDSDDEYLQHGVDDWVVSYDDTELPMADGSDDDYLRHGVNDWVQTRSVEHPEWFHSKTVTKRGEQSSVQQWTSRAKHEDKTTGGYERYTAKEKVSSGKQFVERDTGRVGTKNEYQRSLTLKIGDKSGYTEYHTEQKVQRVNFDKSNKSGNTSGPKNKY